jgi:hypothetical protein
MLSLSFDMPGFQAACIVGFIVEISPMVHIKLHSLHIYPFLFRSDYTSSACLNDVVPAHLCYQPHPDLPLSLVRSQPFGSRLATTNTGDSVALQVDVVDNSWKLWSTQGGGRHHHRCRGGPSLPSSGFLTSCNLAPSSGPQLRRGPLWPPVIVLFVWPRVQRCLRLCILRHATQPHNLTSYSDFRLWHAGLRDADVH